MKSLAMIACVSTDRGLGKGNDLLWNFPEDMKFFRETTSGHTIVMGSNTFRSIGRPLPNRRNIILSRGEIEATGAEVCHSEEELMDLLKTIDDDVFIIGGASLYAMFLPRTDRLYLTEVDAKKPADVFFPEFDRSRFQRQVLAEHEVDGVKFRMVTYDRR